MSLSLSALAAGLALLALTAYTVLAGADFGGGVWDFFARGPRANAQRRAISDAMGPVWESESRLVDIPACDPVHSLSYCLFGPERGFLHSVPLVIAWDHSARGGVCIQGAWHR